MAAAIAAEHETQGFRRFFESRLIFGNKRSIMERRRIPGGTGRSNIAPTCGVKKTTRIVRLPSARRRSAAQTRPLGPRPEYCVQTA